jgi:hypothetical protein
MHERFDKPRRPRLRALAAMTVTVVVGAGLVPGAYAAQAAETAASAASAQEPETVVPAGARWLPTQETLLTAGRGGYLAKNEAGTIRWLNESDGSTGPTTTSDTNFNAGVHARETKFSPVTMELTDLATGTVSTVTGPAGQTWIGGFTGDAILTRGNAVDGYRLHVDRLGGDGTVSDTPVDGLPSSAGFAGLLAQSGQLAVVQMTVDGTTRTYLLDLGAASAREIFAGLPAGAVNRAVIGGTRVVGYLMYGTTAYSVPLDDPAGAVEVTPFPAAVTTDVTKPTPVPVGDRILFVRAQPSGSSAGLPLLSVPVGGGDARTLLPNSYWSYAVDPDGSVLVVGGSGPEDWAVRRVTAAPGADLVVSTVNEVPPVAAVIHGLSYSGGRLVYSSTAGSINPLSRRDLTPGAAPSVTDPGVLWKYLFPLESCASPTGTTPCRHLQGLGTGTVAFVDRGTIESPISSSGFEQAQLGTTAVVTDGSQSFVIANTPSNGKQMIVGLDMGYDDNIVLTRPITASAVWGSTLWVPGTIAGTVRSFDLRTRTFGSTVKTAGTCGTAFKELQADGRWLYWSCGTTAGIHDRQTGKDVSVPAGTVGDASLGDGFLVRHDAASGDLLLTDVHTGAAVTSALANLPVTVTADRGVLWSVDKYGGGVAYVDAQQRIHVLPLADLPRSPIGLMGSDIEGAADLNPADSQGDPLWTPQWTFSRPVASWTLTLKNPAGAVVATRTGTGTAAAPLGTRVSASWDLRVAPGKLAPNGSYKWTLTAQPGDGQGPAVTNTGTLVVSGTSDPRDFEADRHGDLFGLTTAGKLDVREGTATGGLQLVATGAGWPSSDTFVPFGDLDGDRYNDLLVRDSSGRLWLYSGHGAPTFTPSMPHTLVGSGYQQYNLLVSGGALNGDGHPDLLARDASGKLWLHASNGAGGFKARTLVGSGYQQYTLITGGTWFTGDDYDGAGQILARDASGVLWRHSADGKGHFQARHRIGSGWNQYNALVEVGSLTGDAAPDLLARDARGGLWRYADTSTGTLAARAWEGGGWQMYARLF